MMLRRQLPLLLLAAALSASPAAAQGEPRLAAALRLAAEGLGDSARAQVKAVLASTPPSDTLYPQALYTLARISLTQGEMRRNLTQVIADYPLSPWVPEALTRLVQIDYALGNAAGAARFAERLRLDHPDAPTYATAALWAARAYFELRNPVLACRWLSEGLAKLGTDVELGNQLNFYGPRCTDVPKDSAAIDSATKAAQQPQPQVLTTGAPAPTPTPDSARAPAAAPAPTPRGLKKATFTVQVSAASTEAQAKAVVKRLGKVGFDATIVRVGNFWKVRVGSYPTRDAAQDVATRIRRAAGGSAFVTPE